MTLWFDVATSRSLAQGTEGFDNAPTCNPHRQERLTPGHIPAKLAARLKNKEPAIKRFAELLRDALKHVPIRKKTRVSKGAKLRRLEEKRRHSMLKGVRSKRVPIED